MELLDYIYGESCDIRHLALFGGLHIYNARDVLRFLGERRMRVRDGLKVGDEVYISQFKMFRFFVDSNKPRAEFLFYWLAGNFCPVYSIDRGFSVEKCARFLETFTTQTEYREFMLGVLLHYLKDR